MHTDIPDDEEFYDREMSESPDQTYMSPPESPTHTMDTVEDLPSPASSKSGSGGNSGNGRNGGGSTIESPRSPNSPGGSDSPESPKSLNSPKTPGSPKSPQVNAMDEDPPLSQSSVPSISRRTLSSLSPGNSMSPERDDGIWSQSQIQVPDSVADAARHQLCMERFFHPNRLMQPRDQDLSSLDANGKVWAMEPPPLSLPIDGSTWSFVDECHAGITNELLKVVYFFDIVNGMSNHCHWNGFTFPTSDISGRNQNTFLKPTLAPNGKDIVGVALSRFVDSDASMSFDGEGGSVDTGRLLAAGELSASGTVFSPQQLFRISVSFTAAVFVSSRVQRKSRRPARDQEDSDDEEESRQAIFGVVTVTSLRNVDSLRLILVISVVDLRCFA